MLLHFAYGSNMDRALMRAHCPSARPLGLATLAGHRFVIARCGYASVQPCAGGLVHGVLWRLTSRDVDALDRYESVRTGLYDRAMLRVHAGAGQMPALIYVAGACAPGRPRPGYLELVTDAAQAWRLPARYIDSLRRWSRGTGERREVA